VGERPLEPEQAMARAFRDFNLKLELYCQAKHIDMETRWGWEWKKDGSGTKPTTPSMTKVENWFVENLMCKSCQGRKFTTKPLSDFSQHGAMKCHACRGLGYIDPEED
jgi:hypothetical protein